MSNDARHKIHGFWSYERGSEKFGAAEYHENMQDLLLGQNPTNGVDLFRDREIEGGHYFNRKIVDALSKSVLFFWYQTPAWINSDWCRQKA